MTESISPAALFETLRSGALLVTANNRLARVLKQQYSGWRMDHGDRQWPTPRLLSWDAWVDELWNASGLAGIEGTTRAVAGRQQWLSLWSRVLHQDEQAGLLLRPESLARQVSDTRSVLVEWQVPLNHPAWHGEENENHAAFQRWNRELGALCARQGWIAPEDRLGALLRNAKAVAALSPEPLYLLGFDEFTPMQNAWLEAIAGAGCAVNSLRIESAQAEPPRFTTWQARSDDEQLERMARWVRHWLETEPGSRIAVVVNDLAAKRAPIERRLAAVLCPDSAPAGGRPWNLSIGLPLDRWPMIRAAFDILQLVNPAAGDPRVDLQIVGRLLRSPWVSGAREERQPRALLEKCLRENYQLRLKLDEVRYRAREREKYDADKQLLPEDQTTEKPWFAPRLAKLADRLVAFESSTRSARAPSAWADEFDALLDQLGWPRAGLDGETTSHDWQAYQAWQEALRELASLDATLPSLSRPAAIGQLRQVCAERVFQPASAPASVQVLGLYEASGLRFDHLWVMDLHDGNWPPPAAPNPFIPGELQRAAGLPHSSPQRELEVARMVTQRLLRTAPDVVFSWPGTLDGEPVFISPLLPAGDVDTLSEPPPAWQEPGWLERIQAAGPAEVLCLDAPAPLNGRASGGSSILRHQSLCPFRAFASNRLGADALPVPGDGVSPALHGSLLHRVLENFWRETGSQAALLELDEEALRQRVFEHVDHTVNDDRSLQNRPDLRDVEARRLRRLCLAYLQLEKERDAFEVVGFERELLYEIEGQGIRLVIDRVDSLASGGELVIDYKTGKVTPAKWFGERPQDPQLPLYAISAESVPAGVAFAVLRNEECVYKGVVQESGLLPGLPPRPRKGTVDLAAAGEDMARTIDDWRACLHGLMRDFLAGEAAVDPVEGLKTCSGTYCELQPLCRIGELAVGQAFEDLTE